MLSISILEQISVVRDSKAQAESYFQRNKIKFVFMIYCLRSMFRIDKAVPKVGNMIIDDLKAEQTLFYVWKLLFTRDQSKIIF